MPRASPGTGGRRPDGERGPEMSADELMNEAPATSETAPAPEEPHASGVPGGPDACGAPASVYALLADGTTVEIRPAGPGDFDAIKAMHEAMSPANSYMRFFSM